MHTQYILIFAIEELITERYHSVDTIGALTAIWFQLHMLLALLTLHLLSHSLIRFMHSAESYSPRKVENKIEKKTTEIVGNLATNKASDLSIGWMTIT